MPSVLYEKAGWYMIEGRIEDRRIGGRSSRASVVISSSGQVWGGKGREREREREGEKEGHVCKINAVL